MAQKYQRMNTIRIHKMNDAVNIVTIRHKTEIAYKMKDCIDVYVEIFGDLLKVFGEIPGQNAVSTTTKEHLTALWKNGYFNTIIEEYFDTHNIIDVDIEDVLPNN